MKNGLVKNVRKNTSNVVEIIHFKNNSFLEMITFE